MKAIEGMGIPDLIKEINKRNDILRKRQEIQEGKSDLIYDIVKNIETKLDKFEVRFTGIDGRLDGLEMNHSELKKSIENTNKKLDKILIKLGIEPSDENDLEEGKTN